MKIVTVGMFMPPKVPTVPVWLRGRRVASQEEGWAVLKIRA